MQIANPTAYRAAIEQNIASEAMVRKYKDQEKEMSLSEIARCDLCNDSGMALWKKEGVTLGSERRTHDPDD